MDPKMKKWVGQLMRSAIMAAVYGIMRRLPWWVLVLIIAALVSGVAYFGFY